MRENAFQVLFQDQLMRLHELAPQFNQANRSIHAFSHALNDVHAGTHND